jgi:hypothetical protein
VVFFGRHLVFEFAVSVLVSIVMGRDLWD